jgi:hypothetical protein
MLKAVTKQISHYGKSIDNPLILQSFDAITPFLNNLITQEGYHIMYNKLIDINTGTIPIYHFQVFSFKGKFDEIFISINNQETKFIPPHGYHLELDKLTKFDFTDQSIHLTNNENNNFFNSHKGLVFYKINVLEIIFSTSFGTLKTITNFPKDLIDQKILTGDIILSKAFYRRIVKQL